MIALTNQGTRHIPKPGAKVQTTFQQGDSDSEVIKCIDTNSIFQYISELLKVIMVLGFTLSLRYFHAN